VFVLLMAALLSSNITEAQTTKTNPYPIFAISPTGGVQFPIGSLNNLYGASYNFGLEVAMKVNRETSFYLRGGYMNMPLKEGVIGPNGSIIEITAGPRYTFKAPKLKARFFTEGGMGVYMWTDKEYTTTTTVGTANTTTTYPSKTDSRFGVNAGVGVTIPLGGTIDFLIKSKFHYIFGTSGNSSTFITGLAGIEFNL